MNTSNVVAKSASAVFTYIYICTDIPRACAVYRKARDAFVTNPILHSYTSSEDDERAIYACGVTHKGYAHAPLAHARQLGSEILNAFLSTPFEIAKTRRLVYIICKCPKSTCTS